MVVAVAVRNVSDASETSKLNDGVKKLYSHELKCNYSFKYFPHFCGSKEKLKL